MPISVTCDKCQTVISASASKVGQRAKCPKCGTVFVIPSEDTATSALLATPSKPQSAQKARPKGHGPASANQGDVDLSNPLGSGLNAPGANPMRFSSNWSGKSSGWRDAPVWVWCVRGGVAIVALFVVAQVILYALKFARNDEPIPPEIAQKLKERDAANAKNDDQASQASGASTRPLVASTPNTPAPVTQPKVPSPTSPDGDRTLLEYNNTVADNLVQFTVVDSLGRESDTGIGFVIDSSGLVATNFHVLAKAHIARAKFRRGRVHDIAGYRAYDEARDLAIVQLAGVPPGLTTLKLQSEDLPRPGNKALTVGGISGASNSFATGAISSVHTTNELPAGARHFLQSPDDNIWIQTDAVVAAGKTGGPVLNNQLQVIGVNTWSSESQKINFAVSVKHLKVLLDQLKPEPFPFDVVNSKAGQVDKFKQHDPKITELLDEFQKKYEGFNSELQRQTKAGKTQQQIAQYVALNDPVPIYVKKFFTLANERRRQPQALEALASVCELLQLPGAYSAPNFQRVTERILEEHLNDPKLGGMLLDITRLANDDALSLLRQLVLKSKEPQVVGPASYVLASLLQQIKPLRADREQEIVALLQRASRDFAEVPLRETTLGQAAQALLFDVEHLSVGKKAPEIVGTTLQGQELKLSDFAGKIVVIDFFADWNPACSAMYPQLRTLIDQTKDKPVAVLGVALDTKERFQQLVGTGQVTWPCWWDGPDGPVARRWNVQNVPTVFVLDQQGTIRYKFVGASGTSLSDAIQYLLEGYKSSLPPELQPTAEGDLQTELDKLASVVGTQPYAAVVNAAMLLIQAQRASTTRQHLDTIAGWIQKGLELEPNSFSLQLAHNRLQQFQGHTAEAVKQLRDMLKRKDLSKPEISTLRADLARLLVTQTEKVDKELATEAQMLIEEAMFGGHTTEMLDTRAMAYLANNNILQARADMANVLSNKPGPLAYFHSALIESAASNTQGARDALNRAFAEGLSTPQLTPFEQKQLQRLARTLNVPLRK